MESVGSVSSVWPVMNFDMSAPRPAGQWMQAYDNLRDQCPWYRNEFGAGYWTFVNHEAILRILQDPVTFSSSAISPVDPDPMYRLIPEMLDGDEHKQWRRLLASTFAPKAIERLTPVVRERAISFVDDLVDRGSCDFMTDFAQLFPTTIFLDLMGLPVEELSQFMEWEHGILHSGGEVDPSVSMNAMMAVMGRFAAIIEERRKSPKDDLVSKALTYEIDGKPVTDEDLLSFCLLMFMAGLDTVSVTLGWSFLHLAQNDTDRARIVAGPALIPVAVEEFLRVYAIVMPGRKVTADTVIQGCPLKAGDMVHIPLNAATRDESAFPDARSVDIARSPNNHIAFGAGPHRCLGAHLARRELTIALEEWHRRIPDYRVAVGAELMETGGQLGLKSLPLQW